jgi:hypothetical protein
MELRGAAETAIWLRTSSKLVDLKLSRLTKHFGQLLRTRVMAKASGRPGPNAVTGDYRRSWQMQTRGGGSSTTVEVGTNAVQGRRLEFGFNGSDSLGRIYNQPPFPHARPAFDEIQPLFIAGGEALIRELGG